MPAHGLAASVRGLGSTVVHEPPGGTVRSHHRDLRFDESLPTDRAGDRAHKGDEAAIVGYGDVRLGSIGCARNALKRTAIGPEAINVFLADVGNGSQWRFARGKIESPVRVPID